MHAPVLHRAPVEPVEGLRLDEAQQRVVDWRGPGTCVVLGSPGTGATTALIEAITARMTESSSSRILVVARDRDAVRRMRAALAVRAPAGALPTVTTFHGLAYSLVRRTTGPSPDAPMPRLLSGAEEDARIRELLRGAIADGVVPWPADLLAATSTLGFANDLRAMLARARELGLSASDLESIGRGAGVPAWQSLGRLAEIDAEVMALEGVVDYVGLLEMAIDAASGWPERLEHVYVDDFHESGPLHRRLLRALAGPATATVVAADPDVAAFGFRGGDRLGAMRLIEETGAEVIVLNSVHAGAGPIRSAYQAVRREPALPGLPARHLRDYRHPVVCERADVDTTVEVISHDTWGDLVAWVADDLRRRHLGLDGRPGLQWSDIAVIGRSTQDVESVRRALVAIGVPVRVAAADIPLPDEPAVAVLLAAASAAVEPAALSVRGAVDLVSGPLLGLDATDVRRLARALREGYRQDHSESPAPPGTELVRDLLVAAMEGAELGVPTAIAAPALAARDRVVALGEHLASVRALADAGASPGEVLWQAWSGALPDADGLAWPERLRRAALAGHAASGHDIDAVMALFATAERLSDRYSGVVGIRGLLAALQGQRVAAERIATAAPMTPAVALLTPHLSVGIGWKHVVVVGAQEGVWPPPLGGSSALRLPEWSAIVDAAGQQDATATADVAGALRAASTERMAQERRLFALAVSRARSSLVVATVASDADHPSRFVDDLGVESRARAGRPPRPITIDGLIAALRSVAQEPGCSTQVRAAAVRRLALLADVTDDAGVPLAPRADPATWWGVSDVTPGEVPVRPVDQSVALSGSGLATLRGCPLRWFLSRVMRAEGPRGRALAIGSLVHAMAERAARGEIAPEPAAMSAAIDRVWSELSFDAPWESQAERGEVEKALERLCAYLRHADAPLAVEHPFAVAIPLRAAALPGGDREAILRGAIDRIEVTADGRVRLVDFKTARHLPTGPQVQSDPQLGVYQVAVQHGALGDLAPTPTLAGAALVQLRADATDAPGMPRVQEQAALSDDDTWLLDDIHQAIARVRAEDFPAVVSEECRTCPYAVACPAQPEGRGVLA
ncbi:MAG: ATP-dependent helicase [Actinobacteria bacterium]|nr:ATP-dependent helicase [Actinomycetota bacterium]